MNKENIEPQKIITVTSNERGLFNDLRVFDNKDNLLKNWTGLATLGFCTYDDNDGYQEWNVTTTPDRDKNNGYRVRECYIETEYSKSTQPPAISSNEGETVEATNVQEGKSYQRKTTNPIQAIRLVKTPKSIADCTVFLDGKPLNNIGFVASDKWDDYINYCYKVGGIMLKTPESNGETQLASFGDFIVKNYSEDLGYHFYPVKSGYFEANFELITAGQSQHSYTEAKVLAICEKLLSKVAYHTKDDETRSMIEYVPEILSELRYK